VSDTVLCPPLYHPIHDQQIVSLVKFSTMPFHCLSSDEKQSVTVSDSMPSLPVTHFSSHDEQVVSENAFVFPVMSLHDCQQQVSDAVLSDLTHYILLHEQQEVSRNDFMYKYNLIS
jgi:hypothetical protein